MKELWTKLLDKLPVKWIIRYTGVGIALYFGIQFYKENNDHIETMAQIQATSQQATIGFNVEKNILENKPRTKVERITKETEIIKPSKGIKK